MHYKNDARSRYGTEADADINFISVYYVHPMSERLKMGLIYDKWGASIDYQYEDEPDAHVKIDYSRIGVLGSYSIKQFHFNLALLQLEADGSSGGFSISDDTGSATYSIAYEADSYDQIFVDTNPRSLL